MSDRRDLPTLLTDRTEYSRRCGGFAELPLERAVVKLGPSPLGRVALTDEHSESAVDVDLLAQFVG